MFCFRKVFFVISLNVTTKFVKTRSASDLTGLIPTAATNSSFSKSRSKSRSRPLGQIGISRKVLSQGIDMCNIKALSLFVKKLWSGLIFFSKVGQKSRSRSRGKNLYYQQIALATRITHVKYESPYLFGSKVIAKVKFFKSRSKVKVKVTKSKILVLTQRSCHKKYNCEI